MKMTLIALCRSDSAFWAQIEILCGDMDSSELIGFMTAHCSTPEIKEDVTGEFMRSTDDYLITYIDGDTEEIRLYRKVG